MCEIDTLDEAASAFQRRQAAAQRFKPANVRLLLVADGPPASLDRYFYFTEVREHDSLFRYVYRSLTGQEPDRGNKEQQLSELRDLGAFLIDFREDPHHSGSLEDRISDLIERSQMLDPDHIVLIKTSVYDLTFDAFKRAGLPVVDVRVPFPGSGLQARFELAFDNALLQIGMIPSE